MNLSLTQMPHWIEKFRACPRKVALTTLLERFSIVATTVAPDHRVIRGRRRLRIRFLALISLITMPAVPTTAQTPPSHSRPRDGTHDFDWEIGSWTTSLRYLANPLSAETDRWIEYQGTSIIRAAMEGQANLVELNVSGPAGNIRGLSLRLYDPQTHQWSLNFASIRNGQLTAPLHGGFDAEGRGLFYGQDNVDGRVILVRFVITPERRDRVRFVQSFSADAGETWEDNWIAIDQRR
jgi:hypothetical protein